MDELEVRAGAVVNATGVWSDDIDASTPWRTGRRAVRSALPAGQGHPRHRAMGEGEERRSRSSCPRPRTAGRSSPSPGGPRPTSAPPTPTTTVPSTIRCAPLKTSTTCSTRSTGRRLPSSHRTTSSAAGPGCDRCCVTPATGGPPTCPAATGSSAADRGLITVTGGKLTTYRQMAEDAVDAVVRLLEERGRLSGLDPTRRHCRTRRLPLRGSDGHAELVAEIARRAAERTTVPSCSGIWPAATAARPGPCWP